MSIHDRPIWAADGRKCAAVRNPQIQTAGIDPVPGACQLRFAPGTNAHTWDAVSCLRFLGLGLTPGGPARTVRARLRNAPTRRTSSERRADVRLLCMPTGQQGAGTLPKARMAVSCCGSTINLTRCSTARPSIWVETPNRSDCIGSMNPIHRIHWCLNSLPSGTRVPSVGSKVAHYLCFSLQCRVPIQPKFIVRLSDRFRSAANSHLCKVYGDGTPRTAPRMPLATTSTRST
jgi:hypothetical protein